MNRQLSLRWCLVAGAAVATAAAMGGCELLVDFDRSKIPMGDASLPGDGSPEIDAPGPSDGKSDVMAAMTDGGLDSTVDAPAEDADTGVTTTDAAESGIPDTGAAETGTTDAAPDTGMDAEPTADTGTDTGAVDAPVDVVTEAASTPDATGDDGSSDM